jgi:hypothetical protein
MVQLRINSDANDFLKFFQNGPFPRQTFELGKFIITAGKNIKHLVTFVMFGSEYHKGISRKYQTKL